MYVVGSNPSTWTFFTFICCKNCNVCFKKTKINEKVGAGMAHLKNLFFDTHLLERYLDK